MSDTREIVKHYLSALYGGDPHSARLYLANNLTFQGPAASFTNADDYLRATGHAVRAVKRLEVRKIFVEDTDAAAFYDLHIDHPVGAVAIADWYQLDGDKIASIRTILDTGPFATTSTGENAVDPVCGMTVVQSSAPATRTHNGRMYYFCNAGCAASFDGDPDRYSTAGTTAERVDSVAA